MTEGNVSTSSTILGGGGGESTPSEVWMVGGGTPARSGWWGYPDQVWMVGGTPARSGWKVGYPSQVWMVGGVPQPGLDGGTQHTPRPGLDGWGYPGQVWLMGGTQGTQARSGRWGVPRRRIRDSLGVRREQHFKAHESIKVYVLRVHTWNSHPCWTYNVIKWSFSFFASKDVLISVLLCFNVWQDSSFVSDTSALLYQILIS